MKDYASKNIRNVALIGHGGEGKTTLTEAILFNAGAIDRMGRVEDGATTTDFDPEEIKRQISISAALAPVEWKKTKLNIVDVPGYFDFVGEMTQALRMVDSAVIVVGAVSGLNVGAEKAWTACGKFGVQRAIAINQLDREHVDFNKVLNQLKEKYGACITPVQLPILKDNAFLGYVDIISQQAFLFDKKGTKPADVPADLADEMEELREAVVENAAESDEDLMNKYFEEGELSVDEIKLGLKKSVAMGGAVPVFCCAAVANLGVANLMDAMVDYLPAPCEMPPMVVTNTKTNEAQELPCDAAGPFVAQVIKTVADPFVGKLSLFRILSGTLTSDMTMFNAAKQKNEKVGNLYIMRGKKQVNVDKLQAGDIGAVAKLQYTTNGDTLCTAAAPYAAPLLEYPLPCIGLAISVVKEGDEDKVFSGLTRLAEEDPTVKIEKHAETGDTLLCGMGELHLEVMVKKLLNKFGATAALSDPKVPYRETIRGTAEAEGKHKKQTGGSGQFGVVQMRFEPTGDEGFEFVNAIVGGVVPKEYVPAVEKGTREALAKGVLAGYPMVGVKATLFDGKYHPVDSKEVAFKSAARLAYKAACAKAKPTLVEPIYKIEVLVPDEYMGDVIGDMNRRRGRIMGMNPVEEGQEVVAEVPYAEIFKYATDLRAMTQARGSFKSEFVRYEDVPAGIAAKVIEQAKKDLEEEE